MINILEFGHLPFWAGGKQTTGGANAMFQIAYHLSKKEDVSVSFGATDVFEDKRLYDNLVIYGWTKRILLRYCLTHIPLMVKCLMYTISWRHRFPDTISLSHRLMKCVFHLYLTQRLKPDLIHLHNDPEFYADLLCRYAKIVVTVHGVFGNDCNVAHHEHFSKYEAYNAHNSNIALLTFVTNSIQVEYEQLYGRIAPKNVVVLNAFDSTKFYFQRGKRSNKPILCTVASISDRKGQLRVIKGIVLSGTECKYLCVGNGDENDINTLRTFAASNNVDFVYLGKRSPDEIRDILAQSDYMILPSSSEGFGLVYLEAMACGTPVVLPQNLPIVKENGIITTTNAVLLDDCSSEAIAKFLMNIPNQEFDREEVAKSVVGFSWDSITDNYLREMKCVLS